MKSKFLLLDRDGVINKEKNYLYQAEDFEFIDGVFEACKEYIDRGYKIAVITNQSGIGRGYYSESDFEKLTRWMVAEFAKADVTITDVQYCPHTPYHECNCRKPKTGMIEAIDKKHGIDLPNSILVGDKESDIECGQNAGIGTTVIVKSGHAFDEKQTKADYVMKDVKDLIFL